MNCNSCKAELCDMRGALSIKCYGYQPKTNGDRIRAMSDEELGYLLCSIMAGCDEKCPGRNWCKFGHMGTIAWLKQPAKEET